MASFFKKEVINSEKGRSVASLTGWMMVDPQKRSEEWLVMADGCGAKHFKNLEVSCRFASFYFVISRKFADFSFLFPFFYLLLLQLLLLLFYLFFFFFFCIFIIIMVIIFSLCSLSPQGTLPSVSPLSMF